MDLRPRFKGYWKLAEIRMPNAEVPKKSECRSPTGTRKQFGSGFELLTSFGLRHSDFGFHS
jgi:hypothetical protein